MVTEALELVLSFLEVVVKSSGCSGCSSLGLLLGFGPIDRTVGREGSRGAGNGNGSGDGSVRGRGDGGGSSSSGGGNVDGYGSCLLPLLHILVRPFREFVGHFEEGHVGGSPNGGWRVRPDADSVRGSGGCQLNVMTW